MTILADDYLDFWKHHYANVAVPEDELTDDMRASAADLLERINGLLAVFGHDRGLTSGWRPQSVNDYMRELHAKNPAAPNAARTSKHITCNGCDVADSDGSLDAFIDANPDVLEQFGLWREAPGSTHGWCHLQNVQYGSWTEGKTRTFAP